MQVIWDDMKLRWFHCSANDKGKPSLQWRHNECDGVSNHQPHDCLLNCLFRCKSKKTSKLCITGLCEGNSLVTGEFPAQRASNTENATNWWRHHVDHALNLQKTPYHFERLKKYLKMFHQAKDLSGRMATPQFITDSTRRTYVTNEYFILLYDRTALIRDVSLNSLWMKPTHTTKPLIKVASNPQT